MRSFKKIVRTLILSTKKGQITGFIALLLCFLFVSSFFLASSTQATTVSQASIWVDGEPIKTTYFLQNGHVMVPALFFKHTGATVNWNSKYKSVVLESQHLVALPSGKKYMDYYVKETGEWMRDDLATTTTWLESVIYIPLVPTAQRLGLKVTYDPQSSRRYIQTNTPDVEKPKVYLKGETTEKKIALTFDDGPDRIYTPQILDILQKKGVKATFFVVGQQVNSFPELTKRIVNDGHAIANHTWSHPLLSTLNTSQVIEQVESTKKEIARVTKRNTDLFRPPYRDYTLADMKVLQKRGYRTILWSVNTKDYSGKTAEEILAIVHQDKSPGAIILQHNFQAPNGKLDGTVKALPKIIDQLRAEGYKFVTVNTLLSS